MTAAIGAGLRWGTGAALAAGFALALALHHPLGGAAAVVLLLAWIGAACRWPALYLFALPAGLPLLNLSPWSGWIGVEEFDIAVLGTAAAGFARMARRPPPPLPPLSRAARWALIAVAAISVIGVARGLADAGWRLGWFQGYADPLNAWRVGKSWLLVLLTLPLLRRDWLAGRERAMQRFALGMLTGALVVALAVVWERAAYPGLVEIAAHYRTTALFWEMHVGGAAIDAYVVVATPFVAWALWAARTRAQWLLAAAFSLLWAHAVLTTFSRGACLGAAVALVVLGLLLQGEGTRSRLLLRALSLVIGAALLLALTLELWGYPAAALALAALAALAWWRWQSRQQRPRRRALALTLLALVLVFEGIVLVGPDSFMRMRLAGSSLDYESRRSHWLRGVGLLSGEAWLWGLGAGRLPAHYDRYALRGEFSGAVRWLADAESSRVHIDGPRTRARLAGLFSLTQRVSIEPGYRLRLQVRAPAGVAVWAAVCESHLLYNRDCQAAVITVPASREWAPVDVALSGPPLDAGAWYAPRRAVLRLAVLGVASGAEFDAIDLTAPDGRPLLRNGDFDDGLAHWWPGAQGYYVPWHIDNLYLELLIERGLAGLALVLGLLAGTARGLVARSREGDAPSAFIAAALAGLAAVGLVSSVLDVPRVAWIGGVLLVVGSVCRRRGVDFLDRRASM